MKRTLILYVLFMLLTTGVAMAGSIGLDFNNDSAEGRVSFTLNEDEFGKVLFNGRYLYNSDEDTNITPFFLGYCASSLCIMRTFKYSNQSDAHSNRPL